MIVKNLNLDCNGNTAYTEVDKIVDKNENYL